MCAYVCVCVRMCMCVSVTNRKIAEFKRSIVTEYEANPTSPLSTPRNWKFKHRTPAEFWAKKNLRTQQNYCSRIAGADGQAGRTKLKTRLQHQRKTAYPLQNRNRILRNHISHNGAVSDNISLDVSQCHLKKDSWIKRHQLDVTCFIISLFNAQLVPRPAYGYHTTTAKPQRNTNTHRTRAIQPMK